MSWQITKKLASVLVISTLITKGRKKIKPDLPLKRIPCIYYPLCFEKNQAKIQVLTNFGSKINVMAPAYATKLGLKVRLTNVGAQKIDGSTFEMFGIILASFWVKNKFSRLRFF